MFSALPDKPDHDALEREVLELWDREGTFEQVRERNRGGPKWSFFDGPVTANKTLGVHTAWGRALKDVFQRYHALRGFDQRFQNGFDCQGLWIEVGVERELGLNSKREIEEYGLERFAAKCRDVVAWSAEELTRGSKRLGQWMDWGNDYFTFSDTNIEYIWKFLARVHERGWLYKGHRSTEWCPRCGTSISAHELAGSYVDRADPSLYVRFPLVDHPGEALVIWTTTPWTLPANVAAAVAPGAEYGLRENGEWVATARYPDATFTRRLRGSDLVGLRYTGPFDDLAPGAGVEHRVIPWDEVSLDEGTGIVHIAPGCGSEDFELSREYGLAVLTPVDESGRFYDEYGWLHGTSTVEAAEQIIGRLEEKGVLVEAGLHEHRYPECWRCHTPLIFRIADDWFISVAEIREPMRRANADVEWVPDYFGKRMDDWLANMGDWNISRRRYYGLPLPFYPCSCGRLNVIGSRAELAERAVEGLDGLEELRRPWIDRVPIRCAACGEAVTRIPEVGDVWLDAGIVPFSTLGWESPERVPEGYATGASRGLSRADLPDHAYWEEWFPADLVSEMREQIRLWFYSQLFMSVALVGRAPFRRVLGYEKMFDETGREMHGSWGNMIKAEDAFARMGADVMRWQYCAQPPNQNLLFGFGPAHEIKRRLLTVWNSVRVPRRLREHRGLRADHGRPRDGPAGRASARPLARRADARARAGRDRRVRGDADDERDQGVRRVHRRSFELVHPPVAPPVLLLRRRGVPDALVRARPVAPRRVAGHAVPHRLALAEPRARRPFVGLPRGMARAARSRPRAARGDDQVRRVVELGRQARAASGLKLRQPLRRLVVAGAEAARSHAAEIADELRVKNVEFGDVAASELRVKPNLPVLGPKLGPALREVRERLAHGEFEELGDGRFRVDGHELGPDEVLVERVGLAGWAVAGDDGLTVALDTGLDDELRLEGELYDLIRGVQVLRKESGLQITDRIRLWIPDERLLRFSERIGEETLAIAVERGDDLRLEKA